MALRSKILTHALPLIPTHSFTPLALTQSLSSLPTSHQDYRPDNIPDAVIDTLFGGDVGAKKALVQAWEKDGLSSMTRNTLVHDHSSGSGTRAGTNAVASSSTNPGPPTGGITETERLRLREMLFSRLEYSSRVGEHLVEAYASLTSPSSTPSIPLPSKTISYLSSLAPSIPPLYSPPGGRAPLSDFERESASPPSLPAFLDRLPFLRVRPLGPLAYAWSIADEALYTLEKDRAGSKGLMNEPVGAGPEWYAQRIGVSLAYLSAESHLLQPFHESSLEGHLSNVQQLGNPHLQRALGALSRNLDRHEGITGTLERGEKSLGGLIGYAGFIGRSWAGIIRSRGW